MKFRNLADQNSLLISQIKCAQQSLKYTPSKIINLVKVLPQNFYHHHHNMSLSTAAQCGDVLYRVWPECPFLEPILSSSPTHLPRWSLVFFRPLSSHTLSWLFSPCSSSRGAQTLFSSRVVSTTVPQSSILLPCSGPYLSWSFL